MLLYVDSGWVEYIILGRGESRMCVCVCVCVCVSSERFIKTAHVLLLQIDICLCGPLWPARTCAARFRASLLAYLPLLGGLALTRTAHLSLTCFLLEEKLLYLTLSPFHFFLPKFCLKNSNLIINITQIVYLIAIFSCGLKTKSFNEMFLDTETKIKNY